MSQFVYFYRGWEAPASPSEMQQQVKKWSAWFRQLSEAGHLKDRGYPLEHSGKLVKGKSKTVTDGPYAESKDSVGGYSIVDARDIDEAVALAKGCPNFETGGFVEVRPLLTMNP
ncbi:MAG: YciI family protein [Acidobacteriota bacterium]|nr:YciI family protein [Acidobacteriota bacterium]